MEILYRWVGTLPFFKEIYRRGSIDAFSKAHADIRETMADDLDAKAEELAAKKLDALLTSVDTRHIFSINPRTNIISIGGIPAGRETLLTLKSEAEYLVSTNLWNLLHETPKELAQREMFISGQTMEALTKGRSILYFVDIQKKILDTLKTVE